MLDIKQFNSNQNPPCPPAFINTVLLNYFLQEIEEIYVKARKQAIKKSELPSEIFPEKCPFTPAELLDSEFLP